MLKAQADKSVVQMVKLTDVKSLVLIFRFYTRRLKLHRDSFNVRDEINRP